MKLTARDRLLLRAMIGRGWHDPTATLHGDRQVPDSRRRALRRSCLKLVNYALLEGELWTREETQESIILFRTTSEGRAALLATVKGDTK
jgi:hypothetical protein